MILTYARDSMERITGITLKPTSSGASQTVVSSITYDPFGPVTGLTFGNSITDARTYDGDYRMTNITDTGTATIENLTYTPDANDNITGITDAVTPANNQTLGYDNNDRMTSASGSYGSLSWVYDSDGNITKYNGTSWTYIYSGGYTNKLSSTGSNTISYNGNGSISGITGSPAMTFNYFNSGRLQNVQESGSSVLAYLYDGFGQKVTGTDTLQRFYQYNSNGNMIEMTDYTDTTILDYIYLNGWPVATFVPGGTTGTLSFLHTDRLGAPRRATSSTQAIGWTGEYQPFGGGSFSASTIANNLRLPGMQYEQSTGQDYNYNRDYIPAFGRYLESDPIGFAGSSTWGGTMSPYPYANSNPGKNIDPSGLDITISLYPGAAGFDHIGLGVNSSQTVGFYGGSSMSKTQYAFGETGPGYMQLDTRFPPMKTVTIQTTPAQDAQIQAYQAMQGAGPSEYGFYRRNCATTVVNALNAAGINISPSIKPDVVFAEASDVASWQNTIENDDLNIINSQFQVSAEIDSLGSSPE